MPKPDKPEKPVKDMRPKLSHLEKKRRTRKLRNGVIFRVPKAEAILRRAFGKSVVVNKQNFVDDDGFLSQTRVTIKGASLSATLTEALGDVPLRGFDKKGEEVVEMHPEGSLSCAAILSNGEGRTFVGINSPAEAEDWAMGRI